MRKTRILKLVDIPGLESVCESIMSTAECDIFEDENGVQYLKESDWLYWNSLGAISEKIQNLHNQRRTYILDSDISVEEVWDAAQDLQSTCEVLYEFAKENCDNPDFYAMCHRKLGIDLEAE